MVRALLGCMGLIALIALIAACGDTRCVLEPCDIRNASCQRAVLEVARCVRGSDGAGATVPVRVVDADEFIDEQVAIAEMSNDGEADQADADWYRGFALFGLSEEHDEPGDPTRTRWENVAAFYSSEDRAITILDRGYPFDSWGSSMLLVHETIHALQDADLGIEELYAPVTTTDHSLAVSALIEGEATIYQNIAAAHSRGFDPSELDLDRAYAANRVDAEEDLRDVEEPIVKLRSSFAYSYGGAYVNATWQHGGEGAVRALFTDPPRSQREVVFGPSMHALESDAWRETSLVEQALPVLAGDFRYVGSDQLGTFAVLAFAQGWVRDDASTLQELRGVESDVFSVLRLGEDTVAVWRIRFSSEARAARFGSEEGARFDGDAEYNDEVTKRRRTLVDGRDVVLIASAGNEMIPDAIEDLEWTAAPELEPVDPSTNASSIGIACRYHPELFAPR